MKEGTTMRTQLISLMLVSSLIAACGSDKVKRDQQQYEVVQEGSASGTSTALAPMTGTNADTTTAFTIDPSLASAPGTPPGTIAGSLPDQPYGGVGSPGYVPAPSPSPVPASGMTSGSVSPQPAQAPRIVVQRPPAQTATQPAPTQPAPAQPAPAQPAPAQPVEPEPQPVPTDTGIAPPTQTTTQAAPPAEKPKEPPPPPQDEAEPEPEPEEEPPPPPPPGV
jgi:hypothetical protein